MRHPDAEHLPSRSDRKRADKPFQDLARQLAELSLDYRIVERRGALAPAGDTRWTIDGVSKDTAVPTTTVLTEGQQYVLFEGILPASDGTIEITLSMPNSDGNWAFAGLQIAER